MENGTYVLIFSILGVGGKKIDPVKLIRYHPGISGNLRILKCIVIFSSKVKVFIRCNCNCKGI
jgi:hypothetical protein